MTSEIKTAQLQSKLFSPLDLQDILQPPKAIFILYNLQVLSSFCHLSIAILVHSLLGKASRSLIIFDRHVATAFFKSLQVFLMRLNRPLKNILWPIPAPIFSRFGWIFWDGCLLESPMIIKSMHQRHQNYISMRPKRSHTNIKNQWGFIQSRFPVLETAVSSITRLVHFPVWPSSSTNFFLLSSGYTAIAIFL